MSRRRRWLLIAATFLVGAGTAYTERSGHLPFLVEKDRWAITLYEGESPFLFRPASDIRHPALSAADVTDVPAEFVADPFMLREEDRWFMFFEVLNRRTDQGDIGLAVSDNGLEWRYQGIVLDEPFHLSYPYVFRWQGEFYLIPESIRAAEVRLYRALHFPDRWVFAGTLIGGERLADPSIFRHDGRWWLLGKAANHTLRLFLADELAGPWREHPQSPVVRGNPRTARPGGRILAEDGRIIRYAQNGEPYYGRQVLAFEIVELTPTVYRERLLGEPVLDASGEGWNRDGMHHIDPHRTGPGRWLACVDGYRKYWAVGFEP
jgi:hypothetical protein